MEARFWLALLLAFGCLFEALDASPGDLDPLYRTCVKQCEETGISGDGSIQHCRFPYSDIPVDSPWYMQEPLYLQWKQVNCKSDCRYNCMMQREKERGKLGLNPVKYHGKWPFKRVFVFQEPLSAVLSALNLLMHFTGWLSFFLLDEASRVMLAAPILAFVTTHILYLNFYQLDYGWNMKVCVTMGVATLLVWAIWAGITGHPSRIKLWVNVFGVGLALLLEIYDFPPYMGYADAHALWHAATIPLTYLWWSFINDDAIVLDRQKELEEIHCIRSSSQDNADVKAKRIGLNAQESLAMEAACSIFSTLKNQLIPFCECEDFEKADQEADEWRMREIAKDIARRKVEKMKEIAKLKANEEKRRLESEECEDFEKADQEADEWRMREIAKDIARRKVEKMKEIAKLKANEEKRRLESELTVDFCYVILEKHVIFLCLMFNLKLTAELHLLTTSSEFSLHFSGHFLPEEDDKFLERVQAAVEEEERQAAAAADTNAAKDAIATAEESRKAIHSGSSEANDVNHDKGEVIVNQDKVGGIEGERSSDLDANLKSEQQKVEGQSCGGGYDFVANLPFEFYHYYHGSSNDMGTLIEVI
ncbi:putative U11/U12 small nuclear ribonucleoprotein 59 kDa protein-like [Cocos nucifera]|uniref:Putative U11/U12 small nuclear ribonucleoprotein 59 kDa protein-like n=1 Tax=Cocos nucifera TaxID=13894 RepID=A0A8K0MWG7_COCNU|nr:putative U11/U12 small nuclear ribonucleoprotein 59 kDa protein-like [Cocos nucifera]